MAEEANIAVMAVMAEQEQGLAPAPAVLPPMIILPRQQCLVPAAEEVDLTYHILAEPAELEAEQSKSSLPEQ